MMPSEELKQMHKSGDFGEALEGLPELVKEMEDQLLQAFIREAYQGGATDEKALTYAKGRMQQFHR